MNKTIGAISLQENQSMALSSTFTRTRRGHGPAALGELDSFNIQFGHYPRNHQDDSPTQLKMKRTAILLNSNNSFEKYLREMKKRNALKGLFTTQNGLMYRLRNPHGQDASPPSRKNESTKRLNVGPSAYTPF